LVDAVELEEVADEVLDDAVGELYARGLHGEASSP
jgi:hypothetical protein